MLKIAHNNIYQSIKEQSTFNKPSEPVYQDTGEVNKFTADVQSAKLKQLLGQIKQSWRKSTNSGSVNTQIKSLIIEESDNKNNRPSREEDDIIVISDKDDVIPTETKKAPVNPTPPAAVKNTPVNPTPTTVKTAPEKTTATPSPTTVSSSGVHKVDIGQTLYSVARQYNVSVKELAEWNNITTNEHIKVGQTLILKKSNDSPTNTVVEKKSIKPATSTTSHVVKKGETLYSISKSYKVTINQIQEWNNMSDQNAKLGQKLIIKQ